MQDIQTTDSETTQREWESLSQSRVNRGHPLTMTWLPHDLELTCVISSRDSYITSGNLCVKHAFKISHADVKATQIPAWAGAIRNDESSWDTSSQNDTHTSRTPQLRCLRSRVILGLVWRTAMRSNDLDREVFKGNLKFYPTPEFEGGIYRSLFSNGYQFFFRH